MAVQPVKERYSSVVGEVVLGATPEDGGTRTRAITVGGDSTLPFLQFEGDIPNPPVLALQITDVAPGWHPALSAAFGEVWNDPAAWANKAVDQYGADIICLTLTGADPEGQNRSPEQCAQTVKDVLAAVGVPLIVKGCGNFEKDNAVMPVVAEAAAGERLLLGIAQQDNYKTLTAAAMVHKHNIIALSPIDINIAKQLNILITEMNMPTNRIVIDPTIGALGYGIEYSYSIMERMRLGALQGDSMLAMPVVCDVGYEAWRAKESHASAADFPGWGDENRRGIMWEATTATVTLEAGAHILVMRHPEALAMVRNHLAALMVPNSV